MTLIERARIAFRDWLNAPNRDAADEVSFAELQRLVREGRASKRETMQYHALVAAKGIRIQRRRVAGGKVVTCACGAAESSQCECAPVLRQAAAP